MRVYTLCDFLQAYGSALNKRCAVLCVYDRSPCEMKRLEANGKLLMERSLNMGGLQYF